MKIVFYTCSTGPHDTFAPCIKQELTDIDCYYVHDGHVPLRKKSGWNYIDIREHCTETLSGHRHRFAKTHPHILFPNAEYTIWLDSKFYIGKPFFNFCKQIIKDGVDWLTLKHEFRETLADEIIFPFVNGTLSFEECIRVLNTLEIKNVNYDDFFPTLTLFLIRKSSTENTQIDLLWWEMMKESYPHFIRDQIFLPFSGKKISTPFDYNRLIERSGLINNYKWKTDRVSECSEKNKIDLLKTEIQKRTGSVVSSSFTKWLDDQAS
jgi:hypothetical protein